jgi:hypothetical protein
MKFSELKRTGKGSGPWTARLADASGAGDYEMAIRGPAALVPRVFGKSDFEIKIDAALSGEAAQKRLSELHGKYSSTAKDPYADDGENPFKKPSAKVSEKTAVVVSFRRTRGEGTFWSVFVPLFVPRGVSLFFILPPVVTCAGAVFPLSGDPDLFLTLNGAFTPTVSASIRAGTAVDRVSFTSAPPLFFPFVPFFRVSGFAAGFTGFFMAGF